mmetsp:Transcript_81180/g.225948  ORF Transcript_81180/g.225948 Transcript_81180/m.225948 type:complete len:1072 (-) Transcript_81180:141-3356(-)
MPLQSSSSCPAIPKATAGMIVMPTDKGRGRSGSPTSCRVLAGDVRRLAQGLKQSPAASNDSHNLSGIASGTITSPQSGGGNTAASSIEPTGRIGNPQSLLGATRVAVQQQVGPLADRLNSAVAQLQARTDADSRRLEKLERKVTMQLEELRSSQSREGAGAGGGVLAEVKGSVSGLMDEVKALTLRIEGLDERLWARTGGAEAFKQRSRELEQQVQVLEQQSRLAAAASDEAQRRQVAKLRRAEQGVEDVTRRLIAIEDDLRTQHRDHRQEDGALEGRLATIEERQDRVENVVEAVQSQVEELQMRSPMVATDEREISLWRHGGDADDHHGPMATVSHAVEQGIATFDRRFSEQLQDLASTLANVKVKVEGQAQRALTLAERLETAHEPAVDALREELTQARVQDWSRVESELAQLRGGMRIAAEEAVAEEAAATANSHEALRQASVEMGDRVRYIEEGMANEVREIREQLDELCSSLPQEQFRLGRGSEHSERGDVDGRDVELRLQRLEADVAGASQAGLDCQDLDRRLQLLEAPGATREEPIVAAGDKAVDDLREQVQHLQDAVDQLKAEDTVLWQNLSNIEAQVTAVSDMTSSVAAAFSATEEQGVGGSVWQSLPASQVHDASGVSLLENPRTGDAQAAGWEEAETAEAPDEGSSERPAERQLALDAISQRLRAADTMASRVSCLEQRVTAQDQCAQAEVSPDAGFTLLRVQCLAREVSELQARLLASQLGLQMENDLGDDGVEDEFAALDARIAELERDVGKPAVTSPVAANGYDDAISVPSSSSPDESQLHGTLVDAVQVATSASPDTMQIMERLRHLRRVAEERNAGNVAPKDHGGCQRTDEYDAACRGSFGDVDQGLDCGSGPAGGENTVVYVDPGACAELDPATGTPLGAIADQLGTLECVLRGFAGHLDALRGPNSGAGAPGEAACNDGETVQAGADTNVWAHLENLKAHVSMSFGNIMEQRQQIDDTRAFVGTLSEQMAALDASVQYARQQGDQASSECKALAQRLRNLQEHDFVAVCQDVGQTKSLVNELAGLVGCVVERHPGAEPIAYMQSPPIPWTCQ